MTSYERFEGLVGKTLEDSQPWWPAPPRPPAGAPDVVFVVFDDVGYSDFGCYGSEISTPTLDSLAAGGLRYTNFHTTALCSPTRACLLTGRNHHSVGMAGLAEWDHGFPGVRGRITRHAATLAEMLRPKGYATWAIGKWHLTPTSQTSAAGPFDQWPTQRGFDSFYGFLPGETNQYHPDLTQDNHPLPTPDDPGYHLSEDLVTQAMIKLREHQALAPDRPFFLYLCLGACHAPHHVSSDYIDRYVPVFEKGWDRTRQDRLARQVEMGVVPPGTQLPPRNHGVSAWEDLPADQRRLFVRLQAAFAGMLTHADEQLARLVKQLASLGRLANTLFVVLSDNGASQEGSQVGTVNALRYFNGERDELEYNFAHEDQIGQAHLNNNYPLGWAMAGNTPLKRYKQNTHGGGVRDPLIVHWPARITDAGGLRAQFHHVVDVAPTVLEAAGVSPPEELSGFAQIPLEGTSLAYSFDASASGQPSAKKVQYFEMLGHRGIYYDGWKAVAWHRPGTPFEADRWELYHLERDFSECHDLADEHPEKLAEMIERWWAEAGSHQVLPLRDPAAGLWGIHDPHKVRRRHVLYPGVGRIPTDAAPDLRNCSYWIEVLVEVPQGGAEGVLLAHGDWCGGYALYVKNGALVHELNRVGTHYVLAGGDLGRAGSYRLEYRYQRHSATEGSGSLWVDGTCVAEGSYPPVQRGFIGFVGLEVGRAPLPAVGDFVAPWPYTGTIVAVTVERQGDQKLDSQSEAAARLGGQ